MKAKFSIENFEKYRQIFTGLNIVVLVHDLGGNILELNDRAKEYFDCSTPIASSLNMIDLISEGESQYHKFIRSVIDKGSDARIFTLKKKNSYTTPVKISSNLINAKSGDFIVSNLDEFPEIKDIERELREKNNFIDSILENIPNMIFVKDARELRFVMFNKAVEELTGFSREEMLGKNDYDFFPADEADFFTKNDRDVLKSDEVMDISEERMHTKNNGVRILHTKKISLKDDDGEPKYLLGISEDITESIKAKEQITRSIGEKESLLREIHHRVKNNLQVISSLLSLQSDYAGNRDSHSLFQESQNRIYSIALVHEQLYRSKDLGRIDICNYINDLTENLKSIYLERSKEIVINIDCEHLSIDIDRAIPCGLIINELLSNSFKYAFSSEGGGGSENSISIGFQHSRDENFVLSVKDNGVGLPDNLDFRNTETLGLQLVCTLADQLGGDVSVDSVSGCGFKVVFPAIPNK